MTVWDLRMKMEQATPVWVVFAMPVAMLVIAFVIEKLFGDGD